MVENLYNEKLLYHGGINELQIQTTTWKNLTSKMLRDTKEYTLYRLFLKGSKLTCGVRSQKSGYSWEGG